MRICLYGGDGKVGSVLAPALEQAGHEVVDGRVVGPAGCDVAVDFTQPAGPSTRPSTTSCPAASSVDASTDPTFPPAPKRQTFTTPRRAPG